MSQVHFKVGEVAKRTGVSVRTLHYYDEIGLLSPASGATSRHRLYAAADIERLQQIKSMQQLGFSLTEIREMLDKPDSSVGETLVSHLQRLNEQILAQQRLCERLKSIIDKLHRAETVSVHDFLDCLRETTNVEKYYTPDQLEYLAERKEIVGEERIQEVQQEWLELIAAVRAEKAKGTDPASETMRELARRWQGLIDEFTGGDKGIEQSLANMYRDNPDAASQHGYDMDGGLMGYVGQSMQAIKSDENDGGD